MIRPSCICHGARIGIGFVAEPENGTVASGQWQKHRSKKGKGQVSSGAVSSDLSQGAINYLTVGTLKRCPDSKQRIELLDIATDHWPDTTTASILWLKLRPLARAFRRKSCGGCSSERDSRHRSYQGWRLRRIGQSASQSSRIDEGFSTGVSSWSSGGKSTTGPGRQPTNFGNLSTRIRWL